jgi:DNA mismatch endonuclease, patch repair protein
MMAGIKGKNTKPEIRVRKLLHAMGFRFRLHVADLPSKPDIILPKHKSAIFVQGCFWHGHEMCPVFRLPKSRTDFWRKKIGANHLRDDRSKAELIRLGWKVIYIWECAIKGSTRLTVEQLKLAISDAVISTNIDFIELRGSPLQPDS